MLADKNQVAKACLCPKWGDARDDAIICLWPRQNNELFGSWFWNFYLFLELALGDFAVDSILMNLFMLGVSAGVYAWLQYLV